MSAWAVDTRIAANQNATETTPLPPWEETPAEAAAWDRAWFDRDDDTEEDDE